MTFQFTDFDSTDYQLVNQALKQANTEYSDEDAEVRIFEDFDAGRNLYQIYLLAKLIHDTKADAFDIQYDKNKHFKKAVQGKVAKAFHALHHSPIDYHARYDCHDYIEIVLEAMMRYRLSCFNDMHIPAAEQNLDQAKSINAMVVEIRSLLRQPKVQERIRNRRKNAYKNYLRSMKDVDSLFDRRSRYLIVRVDFGYKRYEDGSMVALEEACWDIKTFLNAVRDELFIKHCQAFIGQMEFGEDKGLHFHFFFFFDGAKHMPSHDSMVGQKLGKFWVEQVTSGKGIYHNCNRKKDAYKKLGIGMVHRSDNEKRKNLDYAIGYLMKSDQFVLSKLKRSSRTFYRWKK